MSVSEHPIALRLERRVGGATKLLATVMGLPLVDGIFPALVVADALSGTWGVLQTGLLIFGGSATVAVVLAEMEGTRGEQAAAILLLGAVLVPVAVVEAALAETIESLLRFQTFHRFAGLVILAVAAKTASAEVGTYLPSPGVIVGLGLVASFDPSGAELALALDPVLLTKAALAAGTGVAFALSVALAAPYLRGTVNVDRFRFGSAIALGMLALEVLGLLPTTQPVALGVLAVTALFAFDPTASPDVDDAAGAAGEVGPEPAESAAVTDGGNPAAGGATGKAGAATDEPVTAEADEAEPPAADDDGGGSEDDDRAEAGMERQPYL